MKALFYIPTLAAGGAEKQCSIVAAGLRREYGIDTSIILDYGDKIKDSNRAIVESDDVAIIRLPRNKAMAIVTLWKLFYSNKDAVLFTYLSRPNFVGSLIGRLAGLKLIYSGIRSGWLPRGKLIVEKIVNRFLVTKTVFNSYRGMEHFMGLGFLSSRSIVISNAIDIWEERNFAVNGLHRVRVVTVGRFTPEKDYHTWLLSIRKAIDYGADIEAHIVGWGREKENVRRWIYELNLLDRVTIYPGDYDVKKLLFECDIYLSTSTSEGVSNSILEAMAATLPVVATDVGDNNRMIENGRSGFLAKVEDVASLARYIVNLSTNSDMRCRLGARAREILQERYSVKKVISQYRDLIQAEL